MHIGLIGLGVKTIGAPIYGAVVFSAIAFALTADGLGYAAAAIVVGVWLVVLSRWALQFISWGGPLTWTLVYFSVVLVAFDVGGVAASLVLGIGIHLLYAATKMRCVTIGCCNFCAVGRFGRGTLIRRLHLGRLEILTSLFAACWCAIALISNRSDVAWVFAGIPAHGIVRYSAWRLRFPLGARKARLRGAEALILATLMQTLLLLPK